MFETTFLVLILVAVTALAVWTLMTVNRIQKGGADSSRVRLPIAPDERRCGSCAHFDKAAAQMQMARNPVFSNMVAPFIAPHEYNETAVGADGEQQIVKPNIPESADWKDFGLCHKNDDGVWSGMTEEQRLKNCADWTAGGDCYEAKAIVE